MSFIAKPWGMHNRFRNTKNGRLHMIHAVRYFLVALVLAVMHSAVNAQETLKIGSPAPDFNLPGVDGNMHSLAEFKDANVLVIVFTCNHCPTAQAYENRIVQMAADYKTKGVCLVAISPNDPLAVRPDELGFTDVGDSLADMKIRAKDKKFNFPYLYDGNDQKASMAYGPVATPHVFIFDRDRKLRYAGRVDDNDNPREVSVPDARNAIDALLAGKEVVIDITRTFGCSIKWSDKRESVKKALEKHAKEEVTLSLLDEKGIAALVKNDGRRPRLINVWATWCAPCVNELPEFDLMSQMYRRRGLEVITISADDPAKKDKALEQLKELHLSTKNYLYDGKDKYKLMSTVDEKSNGALPLTVLVDPDGKVLYRKNGEINAMELRKAIVNFLGRTYQ